MGLDYWQVSWTEEVWAVGPTPSVAVSVTGAEVALWQIAVPFVLSAALLMLMSSGSGLVQVGKVAGMTRGTAQLALAALTVTAELK